ncbi:MAG: pimeloyl-ACP methyl ester esterase BioH [Methylotenera sp.]|nr:pimeloyl-ACP methyl ester esterase BioH [Methylotenera sp.]
MNITPANIYIESTGTGPNLVLLHGWAMNGAVWQPLVKDLARHFTLHIVDIPGMGLSRPVEPYHLHVIAEKIAEMMPASADVVGWSWGGQLAMRLALDHPDIVRRLVLVGSTPCFVNKSFVNKENFITQQAMTPQAWSAGIAPEVFNKFADSVDADYHKTMSQFLTLQCMGNSSARSTVRLLRKKFEERPAPTTQTLKKALTILLETDLRAEVELLRKPTLLIHGDRDTLAPVQAAHWLMQNLPAGFLRVMAGASHAPFLSHQEQFIDALVQFLEPA